jgi:hypothetical protein
MECVLCKKDSKHRSVKGFPVCRDCQAEVIKYRDQLNSTRKTPKTKFNPLGEAPITSRDVVGRRMMEKAKEVIEEKKEE